MARMIDLEGQVIGNITVLTYAGKSNKGLALWNIKCVCGNTRIMAGTHITRFNRVKLKRNGCGDCAPNIRHPKEFNAWSGIKQRCNAKLGEPNYEWYGARGITIYEEWKTNFWAFLEYVGQAPGPEYSIEREDNNGNYEPGNICWATKSQQCYNRRSWNKEFTYSRLRKQP